MTSAYSGIVDDNGMLLENENASMQDLLGNGGDCYEVIEEMYWMIQVLADGDEEIIRRVVTEARQRCLFGRRTDGNWDT